MDRMVLKSIALIALLAGSGCASIISGTHDDITINTNPQGADCDLAAAGLRVGRASPTPASVVVPRSNNDITVKCALAGYGVGNGVAQPGINGWVFGNILGGGIIGAFIDTLDGASMGYDQEILITLDQSLVPQPEAVTQEPELGPQDDVLITPETQEE